MQADFEALGSLQSIPKGWPLSLHRLWQTWQWLGQQRPRSLVSYTFNIQALPCCGLARLRGVPKVVMRVGNPPPSDRQQRQRWITLVRLCRWAGIPLVSCSESVHRQLAAIAKLPRGSAPLINGCDTQAIAQQSAISRQQRPPSDRQRIIMVARLDPIKDQAILLHAFAAIAPRHPNWDLWLVGEGGDRDRLESLAQSLGLDPATLFLGRRSDIPALLGQADLFAFSTTAAEGFGIALIEAMAAGLPIVASDVPACREVLLEGQAGVLVPPGDRLAWQQILDRLLSDSAERQHWAQQAQATAPTYNIQHTAQQWYQRLQA